MSENINSEEYSHLAEFGITEKTLSETEKNLNKINKITGHNIDKKIIEFNEYLEDHNINKDRTRITDVLFEEEFVKFFYILLTSKDQKEKNLLLYSETGDKWNRISKGWKEVDVINENKEVIFTVPGLFGYVKPMFGAFDIIEEDGSRFPLRLDQIMKKYNEFGPSIKATVFLEEHFNRILKTSEVVEIDKERYINMWINIFKRYPEILNLKVETESKDVQKDKNTIGIDDLDWW